MRALKCIIADDEPIARQILEGYIAEIPYLELIASCKDAFEVMNVLQNEVIDLLFLDINMPKLSGLSLLKTMLIKPDVIITTAYSEYAVEGFELSVTDYLLKPFSLERFVQAVLKVQNKRTLDREPIHVPLENTPVESLFVKSDKKLIKINLEDVNYVEAYGNYIKIYADKMILTPETLTEFIDKLPPNNFLRIHKSYVVNLKKIKLIEGNQLVLIDNSKLSIGKLFRKALLEKIAGG
ncbi:MAG: LytTR family DNA-binding domain-containing protein [Allomuricauda sp.]